MSLNHSIVFFKDISTSFCINPTLLSDRFAQKKSMDSTSELLTSPARNGDQYTVMQVDKSVLCQVAGHESILHNPSTFGRAGEIDCMAPQRGAPGSVKVVLPGYPLSKGCQPRGLCLKGNIDL